MFSTLCCSWGNRQRWSSVILLLCGVEGLNSAQTEIVPRSSGTFRHPRESSLWNGDNENAPPFVSPKGNIDIHRKIVSKQRTRRRGLWNRNDGQCSSAQKATCETTTPSRPPLPPPYPKSHPKVTLIYISCPAPYSPSAVLESTSITFAVVARTTISWIHRGEAEPAV